MHKSLYSRNSNALTWRDMLSAVLLPCLIMGLTMLFLGAYGYGMTHHILHNKAADDLRAIAQLKVGQIEHWLSDQVDIAHIMTSAGFQQVLQSWLASGQQDESLKRHLLDHLKVSGEQTKSYRFSLRDTQGRLLFSTNGIDGNGNSRPGQAPLRDPLAEAEAEQLARRAVQNNTAIFQPLGLGFKDRLLSLAPQEMNHFIPVNHTIHSSPLAVIQVTTRPEHALYPMLRVWPGNSPSAETILFQSVDDQVFYLNRLRHLPDDSRQTLRPMTDTQLIGAQALAGGEALIEGSDYRGVATLAYVLPVTGTPWMLAAKIDHAEIYRDLRLTAVGMVLFCLLSLFALALWLLQRKKQALHFDQLLAEYDDLYQHAPCGYHSLDKDGVIQRINQTQLDMLGYQREEVIGKINVRQLLTPAGLVIFQKNFAEQQKGTDIINVEFDMIRKDGTTIPVLIKSTTVRDHNKNYLLSRTVIIDLSKQKQVEAMLQKSHEQLRELTRYNDSIQEVERKHLARELHDEFGQMLTLLKMRISLLQSEFDTLPDLVEKTEEMRLLVERIINMIRNIASNLRPTALDLGISGALEWLAADFARNTGLVCNYSAAEGSPQLDETTATAVFRLVQESLTNITRHAEASRVNIRLNHDQETLRLHISDNGRGFDVEQVIAERKKHGLLGMLGLLGMQERINMLRGTLRVDSTPGHGTHIHIDIPLQPPQILRSLSPSIHASVTETTR